MKKIVRYIVLSLMSVCLLANTLFNGYKVYADSSLVIDGTSYVVDSYSTDSNGFIKEIVKNGIKYVVTNWAQKNTSGNKLWAQTVASGILTLSGLSTINDLVGAYDGASQWVLDGVSYGMDQVKQGWDSLKDQYQKSGYTSKSIEVTQRLLGAVSGLDNIYSNLAEGIRDIDKAVESSYRNYYDRTIGNNYRTGATNYYSVVQGDTFYNTYNNTYETINNYNYDIYNNYYNYYTTNNITENHYHVTNNYNNTYVFNNAGNYDYSLYYRLPDGTNSFNLTEDEINGIKTDFNVDNYQLQNSNSDVIGLYHLNGNNINTYSTDNNSIFYNNVNYFPYSSNNYVDSLLGFDTAYMSNSMYIFNIINSNIKNAKFYLYVDCNNSNTSYKLVVNELDDYINIPSKSFNHIEINNNNEYEYYINGIETNLIKSSSYIYHEPNTFKSTNYSVDSSRYVNKTSSSEAYNEWYISKYEYTPYVLNQGSNTSNNYYSYGFKRTQYRCLYYSSNNVINSYSAETIYNSFKTGSPNITYDNSLKEFTTYGLTPTKINLHVSNSNFNYYILDELRLSTDSSNKHEVNFLPYSDGIYYTLPNTDTNNKLLIKSDIPVNEFQFGGIRKSYELSTKGDVFINLTNGYIDNVQQFDGHDWITKEAAIYSEYLNKWVNAIGYSINTGDWTYSDITANDVKDLPTYSSFISNALNDLKSILQTGFDNVITGLKNLVGIPSDTISLDNADSVDISTTIDETLDELKVIDQTIQFNLDDGLGEDINEIKSLAQTITQPIFKTIDDNGLNILLIAPLIIAIVRLVI